MKGEYSQVKIIEAFPQGGFAPNGGEKLLQAMAGATIIKIGSTDRGNIEGGGLIIDYREAGSSITKRIIFAFNECGLWAEYSGRSLSSPD